MGVHAGSALELRAGFEVSQLQLQRIRGVVEPQDTADDAEAPAKQPQPEVLPPHPIGGAEWLPLPMAQAIADTMRDSRDCGATTKVLVLVPVPVPVRGGVGDRLWDATAEHENQADEQHNSYCTAEPTQPRWPALNCGQRRRGGSRGADPRPDGLLRGREDRDDGEVEQA